MEQNKSFTEQNITCDLGVRLVQSSLEIASKMEKDVSVAIVDSSGNLVAFGRSDTAAILSINVSIDKAYTAAISRIATHDWQDTVADDVPIRIAVPAVVPRLMAVGGGQLIRDGGVIIGAIGVSGAHWEGDRKIGEQVLRKFGLLSEETSRQEL